MEGELQRIVGQNLRRYRLERGLSQEKFALALGVHRTYVGGLGRGERNVSLRSLERSADRLGVTAGSLLTDDNPQAGEAIVYHVVIERSPPLPNTGLAIAREIRVIGGIVYLVVVENTACATTVQGILTGAVQPLV